jgi:hypothetical protein
MPVAETEMFRQLLPMTAPHERRLTRKFVITYWMVVVTSAKARVGRSHRRGSRSRVLDGKAPLPTYPPAAVPVACKSKERRLTTPPCACTTHTSSRATAPRDRPACDP